MTLRGHFMETHIGKHLISHQYKMIDNSMKAFWNSNDKYSKVKGSSFKFRVSDLGNFPTLAQKFMI